MQEPAARILVVDDERPIRRFLRTTLTAQGYQVIDAASGEEALSFVVAHHPDIVILDIGLPDLDGIEVTRQIREWSQVPILILSVRDRENDKVAALDAGADDYLTKPFGTKELIARLRVALRRSTHPGSDPVYQLDDLRVDLEHRKVTLQGREVSLTPTEYDILRALVQDAGKVLTHKQILHQVWGSAYEQDMHLLRVNMSNLRRKIEPDPTRPLYILTEAGVGYRLRAEL
jgi:two-component system KDP operon response regulator KdpE